MDPQRDLHDFGIDGDLEDGLDVVGLGVLPQRVTEERLQLLALAIRPAQVGPLFTDAKIVERVGVVQAGGAIGFVAEFFGLLLRFVRDRLQLAPNA